MTQCIIKIEDVCDRHIKIEDVCGCQWDANGMHIKIEDVCGCQWDAPFGRHPIVTFVPKMVRHAISIKQL